MSRENLQQYGLILALIVAGIALPTGIISLTQKPHSTYNEYYNTYYNQSYYYNQTYFGNNETEPDYSKPLKRLDYYNIGQHECIVRNFTINSNHVYWFYWNASTTLNLRFWVIRSFFYDGLIAVNGTSQVHGFLSNNGVYERSISYSSASLHYIPPYLTDWLFVYQTDDIITFNFTLTDEILSVD